MELVSGWADDRDVYLVLRDGDTVKARKLPAKWSAFVAGMNDDDRRTLQRSSEVSGLEVQGRYTRIDFRSRWARRDSVRRLQDACKARNYGSRSNDDVAEVLEGDVRPLRRLLTDYPQLQVSATPRVCYLDLETDPRGTFQELLDGKRRILIWGLIGYDGREEQGVLEADSDDAERALLAALFTALERYDVVLAWNGEAFDFSVAINRQRVLRTKVRDRGITWERWCWLDQMLVFKKYNQAHESGEERTSFALGAIAQNLLGEGKYDFNTRTLWDEWAAGGERRARAAAYNMQDVRLMPRIEAKTGYVALHLAVCHVTRCFPDTNSLAATAQGDGYLMTLGAARGMRFPTRKEWDEEQEQDPFAGAYVMHPTKLGIIDNVHVADFAGMYPSIMRTWNMSPETELGPYDRGGVPHCRVPFTDRVAFRTDVRGLFPEALDRLTAERAKYSKMADDAEPGSPAWDRGKRLSSAYKIINNSFYGIIGSPSSRFFNRTVAESVTQTGAWLIKYCNAEATKRDMPPFYGDTDAFYAALGDKPTDPRTGASADFAQLVRDLNAEWPTIARDHGCDRSELKLEYEKAFRRIVMVSSKRYAGRYQYYKGKPAPAGMKPEIRGLEYKRGDALKLARDMQGAAIKFLLDVDRPPPTAEMFQLYVAWWRERVLRGPLSVDDVMMSQSVKSLGEYKERYTTDRCSTKKGSGKTAVKCGFDYGTRELGEDKPSKCPRCGTPRKVAALPVHVRVAKMMAARGEQVVDGTRIEYLVVGKPENDDDDGPMEARPAHDPGVMEQIDRDYYWEKRIFPATARLLQVVYPESVWVPTAKQARELRKAGAATAAEVKKRGVEDLPLFGAVGTRPRARESSDKSEGPGALVVRFDEPAEPRAGWREHADRFRDACVYAHALAATRPGELELVIEIGGQGIRDWVRQNVAVRIPTGVPTSAVVAAEIAELAGVSGVNIERRVDHER